MVPAILRLFKALDYFRGSLPRFHDGLTNHFDRVKSCSFSRRFSLAPGVVFQIQRNTPPSQVLESWAFWGISVSGIRKRRRQEQKKIRRSAGGCREQKIWTASAMAGWGHPFTMSHGRATAWTCSDISDSAGGFQKEYNQNQRLPKQDL